MGLDAIRMAWGTVLLLLSDPVLRVVDAGPSDARTHWVSRVLGGREILQGWIARRRLSPSWTAGGAAVDAAHAATMLGLAIRRPDYRRPATASGLVAGCFAVADLRDVDRRER
jgi:hypothetical protein